MQPRSCAKKCIAITSTSPKRLILRTVQVAIWRSKKKKEKEVPRNIIYRVSLQEEFRKCNWAFISNYRFLGVIASYMRESKEEGSEEFFFISQWLLYIGDLFQWLSESLFILIKGVQVYLTYRLNIENIAWTFHCRNETRNVPPLLPSFFH